MLEHSASCSGWHASLLKKEERKPGKQIVGFVTSFPAFTIKTFSLSLIFDLYAYHRQKFSGSLNILRSQVKGSLKSQCWT